MTVVQSGMGVTKNGSVSRFTTLQPCAPKRTLKFGYLAVMVQDNLPVIINVVSC